MLVMFVFQSDGGGWVEEMEIRPSVGQVKYVQHIGSQAQMGSGIPMVPIRSGNSGTSSPQESHAVSYQSNGLIVKISFPTTPCLENAEGFGNNRVAHGAVRWITGRDVQPEPPRLRASVWETDRVNKRHGSCLTGLFDALDTASEIAGGGGELGYASDISAFDWRTAAGATHVEGPAVPVPCSNCRSEKRTGPAQGFGAKGARTGQGRGARERVREGERGWGERRRRRRGRSERRFSGTNVSVCVKSTREPCVLTRASRRARPAAGAVRRPNDCVVCEPGEKEEEEEAYPLVLLPPLVLLHWEIGNDGEPHCACARAGASPQMGAR
ncbi:unnamed protein product [Pleuronectes platessa]|uniref:Uncharacterized protein n=1 Tax=Pleuronectes platessa TaxID=8262 RepID=A0A9N7V6A7_PLEPL|nr:unnamed protein product [Pleuronectes platessa]